MNTSLHISKSGLNGLQKNLDIISNNIANVNTTGYKKKDGSFQELLLNDLQQESVPLANNADAAINRGTKVIQDQVNFTQGGLVKGQNPYDLAIEGQGFFAVRNRNNELLLTRDGAFAMDENRDLRLSTGERLELNEVIPKGQWPEGELKITSSKEVMVGGQVVARLPIFSVAREGELIPVGQNRFALPAGLQLQELQDSKVHQGFLETSNVDLAGAMTDMIVTQRSYSLNAKVLQATDDMMQRINEYQQ
ncbi:flagellar hook-basal body protein [Vagococcus silagei]|uniref:Flagellar hook-basal body protein n=1 Tax=Vagococcus silagei TaxID=2508885 RepID=A0A4S3B6V9_9ENTE|nr:flagellar hook-basal body protein [Vagococcus silagei]THB61326.1 flagellar hook-basal body protein [Vagococcus silagei]